MYKPLRSVTCLFFCLFKSFSFLYGKFKCLHCKTSDLEESGIEYYFKIVRLKQYHEFVSIITRSRYATASKFCWVGRTIIHCKCLYGLSNSICMVNNRDSRRKIFSVEFSHIFKNRWGVELFSIHTEIMVTDQKDVVRRILRRYLKNTHGFLGLYILNDNKNTCIENIKHLVFCGTDNVKSIW